MCQRTFCYAGVPRCYVLPARTIPIPACLCSSDGLGYFSGSMLRQSVGHRVQRGEVLMLLVLEIWWPVMARCRNFATLHREVNDIRERLEASSFSISVSLLL